jgi:hypothetical protein
MPSCRHANTEKASLAPAHWTEQTDASASPCRPKATAGVTLQHHMLLRLRKLLGQLHHMPCRFQGSHYPRGGPYRWCAVRSHASNCHNITESKEPGCVAGKQLQPSESHNQLSYQLFDPHMLLPTNAQHVHSQSHDDVRTSDATQPDDNHWGTQSPTA